MADQIRTINSLGDMDKVRYKDCVLSV